MDATRRRLRVERTDHLERGRQEVALTRHHATRGLTGALTGPTAQVALFAIAWRLFSAALSFLVNVAFPLGADEPFTVFERTHLFWDTFARYDSGWYFGIARNGYEYVEGGRHNLAFFPVYPKLMSYLGYWMGGGQANYYLAGIIISWTAFVLAMVVLYRLARLDLGEPQARRAVLFATIFPFAFFFGKVYSESVYLLFTLSAFYLCRQRRWWPAGVSGALATATRVNGILMVPSLAWVAWTSAPPERRARLTALVTAMLACAGIGLYSAYVYALTGSPFEWKASIERWGYSPGHAPGLQLARLIASLSTDPYAFLTASATAPFDALNGLAATVLGVAIPFVWRRFGAGYGLLMLFQLWLPLSSGEFEGLGRYCSVLFPFFLLLGAIERAAVRQAVVLVFATLYVVCLAAFTNVYPLF